MKNTILLIVIFTMSIFNATAQKDKFAYFRFDVLVYSNEGSRLDEKFILDEHAKKSLFISIGKDQYYEAEKSVKELNNSQDYLNLLGQLGFELTSVVFHPTKDNGSGIESYFLKRKLQ